ALHQATETLVGSYLSPAKSSTQDACVPRDKAQLKGCAQSLIPLFNNYAVPEGNVVFNLRRCLFWFRVIPSRVFVHFIIDDDIVITRQTFPRASAVCAAVAEILSVDGFGRKIMIAFDNHSIITIGYHCAMPFCLHLGLPPLPIVTRRDFPIKLRARI